MARRPTGVGATAGRAAGRR